MTKLSIIIPVYNEQNTIKQILQKVISLKLSVNKEIIVVNDGSVDRTDQLILSFIQTHKEIIYIKHTKNQGKGAAVKTGINKATGQYVIIQDADLEYEPRYIPQLLAKVQKGNEVIYGSRLTKMPILFGIKKTPILLHYFGNRILSLFVSILFHSNLTDMETGYKLFPKNAAEKLNLKAKGFELEPEITTKLLKLGFKIIEIPIETKPRDWSEGKKLNTWKDGIKALRTIVKYRFSD